MNGSFLTVKKTAKILNVTTRTIHNYINDGRLPAVKIGKVKGGGRAGRVLIKESDLQDYIEKSRD
jgi:excisionase family DNA binding protein